MLILYHISLLVLRYIMSIFTFFLLFFSIPTTNTKHYKPVLTTHPSPLKKSKVKKSSKHFHPKHSVLDRFAIASDFTVRTIKKLIFLWRAKRIPLRVPCRTRRRRKFDTARADIVFPVIGSFSCSLSAVFYLESRRFVLFIPLIGLINCEIWNPKCGWNRVCSVA